MAALVAVHLLIAAHIAHAILAKQTLSPAEPSEAMYTLELGRVNAGALLLAACLLTTVAFGRFFCGWACHLVALQDLCAWAMGKAGVRPKPFRSRLLAWAPAILALYMFAWPTVLRWATNAGPHPGFSGQLMTGTFWATFPGPAMAALTFVVCGFAAVYLLGSKGFCTYGCPYGALFAAADRASPTRIVVDPSRCDGCGHCTANCTSNVLVHDEVRRLGMVVDSACMKCLDCASACPTAALSLGLARPPALRRESPRPGARTYDLTARQEVVAAVLCLAATLAFRGLYDGPPLLLAATLGVLTVYLALKAYRLATSANVSVQTLTLKAGGKVRWVGWLFGLLTAGWIGFAVHSGAVQALRALGRYHLEQTGLTWVEVRSGTKPPALSGPQVLALRRAKAAFVAADRWGLGAFVEVKLGRAWVAILSEDAVAAERHLRAAVLLFPDASRPRQFLVEFLQWQGRFHEAVKEQQAKLELGPPRAEDHFLAANLLVQAGRQAEAIEHYRTCLGLQPSSPEANYNLGALLRRMGRPADALPWLRAARALSPEDPQVLLELCLAYLESGSVEGARSALKAAEPALCRRLHRDPRLRGVLVPIAGYNSHPPAWNGRGRPAPR